KPTPRVRAELLWEEQLFVTVPHGPSTLRRSFHRDRTAYRPGRGTRNRTTCGVVGAQVLRERAQTPPGGRRADPGAARRPDPLLQVHDLDGGDRQTVTPGHP